MAYHGPPSEIELYPLPFLATIRYYSQRHSKLIPSPKVDRDKLCVVIPRRCASQRFLLRLLPWPCFSRASVPPDDLWEFNATKVFTEQREFFIHSPSCFLRLTACHAFERTNACGIWVSRTTLFEFAFKNLPASRLFSIAYETVGS